MNNKKIWASLFSVVGIGLLSATTHAAPFFGVVPENPPLPTSIMQGTSKLVNFKVTNQTNLSLTGVRIPPYPNSEFPLDDTQMSIDPSSGCNQTITLAPGQSCTLVMKLDASKTPLPPVGPWFSNGNFQICSNNNICTKLALGAPTSGWNMAVTEVPANLPAMIATPDKIDLTSAHLTDSTKISNTATTAALNTKINFGGLIGAGKITAIVNGHEVIDGEISSDCPASLDNSTPPCIVQVTVPASTPTGLLGDITVQGDNFESFKVPLHYDNLLVPALHASDNLDLSVLHSTGEVIITNTTASSTATNVTVDFGSLILDGKLQKVQVNHADVGNDGKGFCPDLAPGVSCEVFATATATTPANFTVNVTAQNADTGGAPVSPITITGIYTATSNLLALGTDNNGSGLCYAGYLPTDSTTFTRDAGQGEVCGGQNAYLSSVVADKNFSVATVGYISIPNTLYVGRTKVSPPWSNAWVKTTLDTTADAGDFSPESVAVHGGKWLVVGNDKLTGKKVMVAYGTSSSDGQSITWSASELATAESGQLPGSQIQQVVWSNNFHEWIAVGNGSDDNGSVIYTNSNADGRGPWTVATLNTTAQISLFGLSCMDAPASGQPVCMAVGSQQNGPSVTAVVLVLKTINGDWEPEASIRNQHVSDPRGLLAVAENDHNAVWLAIGVDNRVYARINGEWQESSTHPIPVNTARNFSSVAWNGQQWMIAGTNGDVYLTGDTNGLAGWERKQGSNDPNSATAKLFITRLIPY